MVDLGMSSFPADRSHQSHRPSVPGLHLVCWHLHNSMSIFQSTSCTACLLYSFYASGRRVLTCVFRLPSSVSVQLGLGMPIDVSSSVHDPHCTGEILFLYWYPCEVLCTAGNNDHSWRALATEKGQWMSYVESFRLVNVRNCFSQQPYSP